MIASLTWIMYAIVIYPLIVKAYMRFFFGNNSEETNDLHELPKITIITAIHNESRVILAKVRNLLDLDYPRDFLEIIIASDGSNDLDNNILSYLAYYGVKVLLLPRNGKNNALNEAVMASNNELIIFTDADWGLSSGSLILLVRHFSDEEVGGVSGEHHYGNSVHSEEELVQDYGYKLRMFQNRFGGITSASGAVLALRKSIFVKIPPGVADDTFLALQVARQHKKMLFDPRVVAFELERTVTRKSVLRKVRVLSGWFLAVWLNLPLLNPCKYKMFAINLWSAKLLRRLLFVPAISLTLIAIISRKKGVLKNLTISTKSLFSMLVLLSLLGSNKIMRDRVTKQIYEYILENIASIIAISRLIAGVHSDTWETDRGS